MGLTKQDLLAYLEGVPAGTPITDIIHGAGYAFTRDTESGSQTVLRRTDFWSAVAAAKGEELGCLAPVPVGSSDLKVTGSRRVVINAAHLRHLGASPGDIVRVRQQSTAGDNHYLTIQRL